MANKIQIRRGLKANLPALDVGEPALCTDTKEVFVGNSGGNVALINKEVMDSHLENYILQIPYGVASGSANTYTVTLNPPLTSYTEGVAVAVKINASNTGASTININGKGAKSIRDPRGNALTAGKLIAGSIYTLRYNGTNFILQGEGATGNATASDLLSGKTASTDAGEITGSMPNRTGHVTAQSRIVSGTTLRFRPQPGYYDGSTTNSVQYSDSNFIASNILKGKSIFGLSGSAEPKRLGFTRTTAVSYTHLDVYKRQQVDRNIRIYIKEGIPNSNPTAPSLERGADIYELGLANIYVAQGAYEIREADITDTRLDTESCGIVNSILQADTTAIFNQYQSWFNLRTSQYDAELNAFLDGYEGDKADWVTAMEAWTTATKAWYENSLAQFLDVYKRQAKSCSCIPCISQMEYIFNYGYSTYRF